MNNSVFTLKNANDSNKPAIWFKLHGRNVIVYPLELYKTFWCCDEKHYIANGIIANFLILSDIVFGSFYDNLYGYYRIDFLRDDFIESAKKCLREICQTIIRGEEVYYKKISKQTAKQILQGLDYLTIPQNCTQIHLDEINIEEFVFKFTEPYSFDTPYIIKIGNRTYESYLSDWTNDFNKIRVEIERVILSYDSFSEVNLHFEDSPDIIRFTHKNICDTKETISMITIYPNSFIDEPILFGWCKKRQVVRSLYLGLCIKETDWEDDRFGSWKDFRLATYNKLQSCFIENYIEGIKEDEHISYPRQRYISSVEEMKTDFQNLIQKLL